MENPYSASPQALLTVQRLYGNRAVGEAIQRASIGADDGELDRGTQDAIDSARGGGQPLDQAVGAQVGGALGADFSNVKVHTDSNAGALNRTLSAKAFTTGSDVFFSQGAYQPYTSSGKQLLAHELTHVVQQGSAKPNKVQTKLTVGAADDRYEQEAEQAAQTVVRGGALKGGYAHRTLTSMPDRHSGKTQRVPKATAGGVQLGGRAGSPPGATRRGDGTLQRKFDGDLLGKSTDDVFELLKAKYTVTIPKWKVDGLRTDTKATYSSVEAVGTKLNLPLKVGGTTEETRQSTSSLKSSEPLKAPSSNSEKVPSTSGPRSTLGPVTSSPKSGGDLPEPRSTAIKTGIPSLEKPTESTALLGVAPEGESELKVVPYPKLNKPVRDGKVFAKAQDHLKVEVIKSGFPTVQIVLFAGQDYLNDELSLAYHDDVGTIKTGEVDYSRNSSGKYVLGGGHHRFLWMSHHNKPVKAALNNKPGPGGDTWTGMTYKKNPKKKELPVHMATGDLDADTPKQIAIETDNLDVNPTGKALRAKWAMINWGPLKKPRLVFSAPEETLTTTANYNGAEHAIKIKITETDPVKIWDNVLFEAQNALNADVFHVLAPEKSSTSAMSFKAYGQAMATAEYDSVNRYVTALRELIHAGLDREQLTALAKTNLEKWEAWDLKNLPEPERIKEFNATAHSVLPEHKGTKGELSSAGLYEYEAIEGSEKKHVMGKLKLQIKDLFSPNAKNGYYMRDAFKPLRQVLDAGPVQWPANDAPSDKPRAPEWKSETRRRPHKYHQWIEAMKSEAAKVPGWMEGPTQMKKPAEFIREFTEKMDVAELSSSSIALAAKNDS